MKVAIMQPYFLPYIGYFQLIRSVDTFVIYDDVNYIKQGWINRNNILINNQAHLFTLTLNNASSFKPINQIDLKANHQKILKTIYFAYLKAKQFPMVYNLMEDILLDPETNLAKFIFNSIKKINQFLQIETKLILSSAIEKNNNLKGQEKVIEICKILKCETYINSIGGQSLYSKEEFKKNNINLKFIKSREISYEQLGANFVPWLSIVDVMMFNPPDKIRSFLDQYDLI